jgi:hypothetical protein
LKLPLGFNLNGILATPDGNSLIGVQSGLGISWCASIWRAAMPQ